MKKRITLILLTVLVCLSSVAVTRDEMEQARTITAQAFLRYMNNGSGYLEDLNPTRVSDLKKSLKEKELENLKKFESISYPKIDVYKNWDKAQLVEFWGTKFFADSKVPAEAQGAKTRVRARINAMTINPATEGRASDEALTQSTDNATDNAQRILDSIAQADSIAAEAAIIAASSEIAQESVDTMAASQEEILNEDIDQPKSKSSPTFLYSIILIVLVIAVVALIIYAMRSFKKSSNDVKETNKINESSEDDDSDEDKTSQYEAMISAKDREILSLKAEIEHLHSLLSQSYQARNVVTESENEKPAVVGRPSRTIYLAYANNKGMFVRADSAYNEDYSIFRLVTTDGMTGSFTIINNPVAQKLALSLPVSILSNTCQSEDLQHGNWSKKIVTENAGTAIFENGRWIVKRKADINFI